MCNSSFDASCLSEIVQQIGNKLYTDFAGPQNWEVYPDVVPTLQTLKQKGLVLGVISNFDDRLKPILRSLKIADLFDFTLASYEVGFCKPDPRLVIICIKFVTDIILLMHVGCFSWLLQWLKSEQTKQPMLEITM